LDDPNSRKEDEVYRELAAGWKDIAQLVVTTAAQMAAHPELPMGAHDFGPVGRAADARRSHVAVAMDV
jgi:hypothetical protein